MNPEKCELAKTKLKFLGHIIDHRGIQADPDKTSAIQEMVPPRNITELQHFMGMTNQLGKFSNRLAELTQPLRQLLSKKSTWTWGPAQDQAFTRVKEELGRPTVLAMYDPEAETKLAADASSYGLGAVLLQESESTWRPVAYASRSMSETERRYAQIEKEALAITWACEKFSCYILGKKIQIETDHKPLVSLLGSKHLDTLPSRVLRFRLRLTKFTYTVSHVAGKNFYTADTLSRTPTSSPTGHDSVQEKETEYLMEINVAQLPASRSRLDEYRDAQASDPVCSAVLNYCQNGWPTKHNVPIAIKPYWKVQSEITTCSNLLLYRNRIVIPEALQTVTLQKLHQGHQGITRCRLRANYSVWWPGLSKRINDLVQKCPECRKDATSQREPLLPTKLPDYPWQRVGTDMFALKEKNYLLVVDYFSRYPEVIKMKSTTSDSIIEALKAIFSRHGVPETVVSDNGPQYSSREFHEFAKQYSYCHVTSSPHYPQSNGQAERFVKTTKKLLSNSQDPYMALLSYRTTPLPWCNITPAELLMGRKLRTNLPQLQEQLKPDWPYLEKFQQQNNKFKCKQKQNFDQRHRVRLVPQIPEGTDVWITSEKPSRSGQVTAHADHPRSYMVNTPTGQVRRNRHHLQAKPTSSLIDGDTEKPNSNTPQQTEDQRNTPSPPQQTTGEHHSTPPRLIMTRLRSGVGIRPPDRFF